MLNKKIWSMLSMLLLIISCSTNPFTGQQTIALVSNNQLFPSSFAQYNQVLNENKIVRGTKESEMLQRVGQKIAVAAERYLNANGYAGYTKDYKWEYSLIDSDQVNAWAMPGGKIAFYTGIFPVAASETGIAVVMAHEVAHILANHGQQRMSKGVLQQLGGIGVALATSNKDPRTQQIWMQAYGVGSTVGVMLPYSRAHENEADEIGQLLMAIAGYDPHEAVNLWKRMAALSNGQAPPQFLSTHPHSLDRMQNLNKKADFAANEAKKFGVTSFKKVVPF